MLKFTKFASMLLLSGLLLQSCAAPLMLMGAFGYNQIGYPDKMEEAYEIPYEEYEIPEMSSALYLELSNISETGENIVYVGEANPITIYMDEDVDPANLVFLPSMGRIEKGTEEDSYLFYIDKADIDVEIVVTDTVNGYSDYLICYSAYLPLPAAFLQKGEKSNMKASTFKEQKMLQLELNDVAAPVLCDCKSFRMTRISNDGKREALENRTNGYSEQVKALVAKAAAGDIYIFDNIMVNCPGYTEPKPIKSLAYTIE